MFLAICKGFDFMYWTWIAPVFSWQILRVNPKKLLTVIKQAGNIIRPTISSERAIF
jgi:hypothetical protein